MKRWILAYALALGCLLAVGWPPRARVERPRTGVPAEVDARGFTRLQASTSLPWVMPAEMRGSWVKAMGGIPEWRGNRLEVKIATPIPGRRGGFRLVQVADVAPPGREALMAQFLREMEALKPDAILITGDLAYAETPEWYGYLQGWIRSLEVQGTPVVLVPGNHERKGWPEYLRHFGPATSHRVDLGPLCILSLDSAHGRDQLTPSQWLWLEKELQDTGGRTPLIQLHHPVFPAGGAIHGEAGGSGGSLKGFQKRLVSLCVEKHVAAVLSGHWHSDAVFDATGALRDDRTDFEGPKFIVTTALGNELRRVTRWPKSYYGYRILDFEGGRLVRYTHGLDAEGRPQPIASTPLGLPAELREFPR
jgi:hypothetical protein